MEMMKLQVAAVRELAEDTFEYILMEPDGGDLPEFTPGAHVDIAVPIGGMRKYSLVSDPIDRSQYVLAIKREPQGEGGSVSFIDTFKAGMIVEVSVPRNDFPLEVKAGPAILIAGGIGITPILCMARYLKRIGLPFELHYLTRTPEGTAYRQELLEGALADHATIHHTYGDSSRRLDLRPLLAEPDEKVVYCCGSTELLHAVRAAAAHWPRGTVHFEDFGTTPDSHGQPGDKAFRVRLQGDEEAHLVPSGRSILEVLRDAGLDLPSSCEAGTCGACRMVLVSGTADHRDLVLFPDEYDDNIIICCSRAKTEEIVIAFPPGV